MRTSILLILGLSLVTAGPLRAETFARAPIAPDLGLDALTRAVARERMGRDVFAEVYATVTISNVDLYDRFPYVEARHFQVVSDPRWSRLIAGQAGHGVTAFDGRGTAVGALKGPRGMAVDERNRIYVADAGNDRVVVLQAVSEFDHMALTPLYTLDGLSAPYDVAYSDGGTPFQAADDLLYVADTGRNQVLAYQLSNGGARQVASIGTLGSGRGCFAGPMAIAAGRSQGVNTRDVYVADAHNRRIVRLVHGARGLEWAGEARAEANVVTSLDVDQWGNLYAAAPQQGSVRKLNAALEPVAELRDGLSSPSGFHVPFFTLHDHRDGSVVRLGQPTALSIDQWSDAGGVKLWRLGVAIEGLTVVGGATPKARFTLTDRAAVTLEINELATGRRLMHRALEPLAAGVHEVALSSGDLGGANPASDLVLRLAAASSYEGGASDAAQAGFRLDGGGTVLMPARPALLGNWPNPGRPMTRISFLLPASGAGNVSLAVFDPAGRRVRRLTGSFTPGLNEVVWDGLDDGGRRVRSGLYFYRLEVDRERFTRSLALVH